MKKLLKQHGFNSDMQYYEVMRSKGLNGDRTGSKEMFLALPKANRIQFVKSLLFSWGGATESEKMQYFNLLTGLSK
ncbi:hypothetical protein [Sphingobacterium mizutaii]|uniref:hypothetical protein n=1 Tax=Sphingobacterium mizutaii TaxID=1010 RepID=UPI00289EB340|nr:hypothetical protein [Sphingobacterium mizutaii]